MTSFITIPLALLILRLVYLTGYSDSELNRLRIIASWLEEIKKDRPLSGTSLELTGADVERLLNSLVTNSTPKFFKLK